MKNFTKLLTLLLLFFTIFAQGQTAKVIYVQDGDTFRAKINNGSQVLTVRLASVDTPELSAKYGQKVKSYIMTRILHKTVKLKIIGIDKYGRTLAHVYMDGKWLQEELLELGFARHYKYFCSNEILAEREYRAKKNKIGIWKN